MQPRVELLGHIIGECGVDTDENKVQQIKEAEPSRDAKEFGSFLDLTS